MMNNGEGLTCLDDVLQRLGHLGRYHLYNYALLAVSFVVTAFYGNSYIFLAGEVAYRCVVPECEAANSSQYWQPWLSSALPAQVRTSQCSRYMPYENNLDGCSNESFTSQTQQCTDWIYESHDTIVSEFGLACQEWKRTLVGTIHNVGMLVSLPIFGYISDKWGRKLALSMSAALISVIGTVKAFSVSYEMYVLVEILEMVMSGSIYPAAYILSFELLSRDKRVLLPLCIGITLIIGDIFLALSSQALPYWRSWLLAVYPPSIIFASYFFILPESIRWLVSKGRKEQAVKLIMKAAKVNNVTLIDGFLKEPNEENSSPVQNEKQMKEDIRGSLTMQVLKSPVILTRLLICSFWWITCSFVFHGLLINSVSLAGNKYINYILVISVEMVGLVTNTLVLDRMGRKRTLMATFATCGIALVSFAFIPKSIPWLATSLYLLGKIAITMAFHAIYMYTSELFPTHARHSLLGFCSMVGRIGSITAPQTPLLAIYVESLPSILFGTTAIISSLLMMFTPETLNTRLPDTMQEAEDLAKTNIEKNDKKAKC